MQAGGGSYGINPPPEMLTSEIFNTISTYLCSCNIAFSFHQKRFVTHTVL